MNTLDVVLHENLSLRDEIKHFSEALLVTRKDVQDMRMNLKSLESRIEKVPDLVSACTEIKTWRDGLLKTSLNEIMFPATDNSSCIQEQIGQVRDELVTVKRDLVETHLALVETREGFSELEKDAKRARSHELAVVSSESREIEHLHEGLSKVRAECQQLLPTMRQHVETAVAAQVGDALGILQERQVQGQFDYQQCLQLSTTVKAHVETAVTEKIRALNEGITSMQELLPSLQQHVDCAIRQVGTMDDRVSSMEVSVSQVAEQVNTSNQRINDQQVRLESAVQRGANEMDKILEAELEQRAEGFSRLEDQFTETCSEFDTRITTLELLQSDFRLLNGGSTLEQLREDIESLQVSMTEVKDRMTSYRDAYEEVKMMRPVWAKLNQDVSETATSLQLRRPSSQDGSADTSSSFHSSRIAPRQGSFNGGISPLLSFTTTTCIPPRGAISARSLTSSVASLASSVSSRPRSLRAEHEHEPPRSLTPNSRSISTSNAIGTHSSSILTPQTLSRPPSARSSVISTDGAVPPARKVRISEAPDVRTGEST
jgi:chromosome segregation ATPase